MRLLKLKKNNAINGTEPYPPTDFIRVVEPLNEMACLVASAFFNSAFNRSLAVSSGWVKRSLIKNFWLLLKQPYKYPSDVNRKREHPEQKGALSLAIMPKFPFPGIIYLTEVESAGESIF